MVRGRQMETRRYSYKVDKQTGDILPIIVDKFNHCGDAVDYSHAAKGRPRRVGAPRQ